MTVTVPEDQRKQLFGDLDSQATEKSQPNKNFNSGSNKIDGANPSSPSTNNATRREQYNNYIKTLNKDQATNLYQTVSNYKEMGLTNEQIYENVLSAAERNKNGIVEPTKTTTTSNYTLDLKPKGNFDMYEPKIDVTNADATFQKAVDQLNDSIKSLGSLKLASENYQYTTGSTNVADINNLIKEIQKAYTAGIYDTSTIANQLGVDQEVIRKIQQGKASELVSIGEEFAQEKLKDFFRAEEDYDTNLQRTMEDYNLEKTNLDAQFNSAMQTLKRSMFDEKRAASVGSAIADRSGSEYMIQRVEKGYQQNMDDLENNYIYSSLKQRASYIRAIQDYNTNIQRLGEDFDDAVKSIQLSVLQQFQEIDNKILTAEDNLKALSKLQGSTSTAMSDAVLKYIQGIEDANERQKAMQNFIAANYGYDVSELTGGKIGQPSMRTERNNNPTAMTIDVAKTLGLVEGVDYIQGDSFQTSDGRTLYTAKLLGDPIETTIKAFDTAANNGVGIFTTKSGNQRWTYINMTNEQWKALTDEQKRNVVYAMLQHEGGNMNNMSYYYDELGTPPTTPATSEETYDPNEQYYISSREPLYQKYAEKKITSSDWQQINNAEGQDSFLKGYEYFAKQKKLEAAKDLTKSLSQLYNIKKLYNEAGGGNKFLYGLGDTQLARADSSRYNVKRYFNQNISQGFIDTIIESKGKGATYGALSDNEGTKLSDAYTALSLLQSTEDFNTTIDEMINNLEANIKELGGDYTQAKAIYQMNKKGKETAGIGSRIENTTEYPTIPSLSTELNNPIISPEKSTSIFNTSGTFQNLNSQGAGTGTVFQPHF